MRRRTLHRSAGVVLGSLALLGLWAAPASADPPRPTNYRSTVTGVEPALPPGVRVRVIGGDSLLELTVPRGHTAVVTDYPGSADREPVPYLRFDADGTVRRNRLAVATSANQARYGTATEAPDPGAEPEWETVARNGEFAWHDHRIHWMSPKAPRAVAADGRVDLGGPGGTWEVPITVDGTDRVVTGTLVLVDPPLLAVWVLLAALAAVVTIGVGLRWGQRGGSVVGAVTALAAFGTAWGTWHAVPPDAGAPVAPVLIAGIAVIAGLVATLGPAQTRLVAVAASAAALVGWGATRATVLSRAVLPTDLAPSLDRGVTATAIGVGLALAGLLVARPEPRRTAPPASAPDPGPEAATASPTA